MKRKTLSFEIGEFVMRINPKLVDIETKDKQWKTQFGSKTKEYAQIMFLMQRDEKDLVKILATLLFYAKLVVTNKDFLQRYHTLLKEFFEANRKKQEISKEEDDKILKEEETLHENK